VVLSFFRRPMRITSRKTTIAFFITLGVCLAAAAAVLSTSWVILNWREIVPLILGVIFFCFIIAGVILNTIFLVREIRRNEQQDSFLNAVTHELKTPITSIRLYLETLQKRNVDEEQRREFYQVMLDDTQRLMGTVEQVLRAARVVQKNALLSRSKVEIGPLVQDALDLARSRHHLSLQAMDWTTDGRPAERLTVMGDREELATALSNVFDNAVKYSHKDVGIRVEVLTPDLRYVQIRVSDNGIGVSRGDLKRIFKRFYRVLATGTTQIKGSGLGLFIVRAIARRHGGNAYAESEGANQGTTVTIQLPRNSQ
jgi:two-component system, OmpR family, sensor histidine kinase SenX3